MSLRTVPVTFAQAQAFVADWHRHHRPPRGHKFSIGVADPTMSSSASRSSAGRWPVISTTA